MEIDCFGRQEWQGGRTPTKEQRRETPVDARGAVGQETPSGLDGGEGEPEKSAHIVVKLHFVWCWGGGAALFTSSKDFGNKRYQQRRYHADCGFQ